MKFYFSFTDESGTLQVKDSPFYVRGTIMIEDSLYKEIVQIITQKKKKLNIPLNEELKWSDIRLNKNSKRYKEKTFLHNLSVDDKENFIIETLKIPKDGKCKIIYTITCNETISDFSNEDKDGIIKDHIHYLFQRLQMDTQQDNYTLLIMDELQKNKTDKYKSFISEISNHGDFIDKYNCVYGGILIDESDKCIGLQIVDYICGIMNCILKSANKEDSAVESVKLMYNEYVYPMIRQVKNQKIGYGIIDIPHNEVNRKRIKELVKRQK